jgi:acetylornithine deacetylase/succinyl-diaminopimelate desuccinylase-like protein
VAAVDALLRTEGKLPVNIKFLIEGEEEIGSVNLRTFIREHQALLAADCVVISDSSMLGPDQPTLIYSLRGLALFEIKVRSARRDLHSGSYGGVIHNPHLVLSKILAAMHDENGTITIPGFYDDVLPLSEEEAKLLSEQPQAFLAETGARQLWGEAAFSPRARVGARPTFEVHGITGGFIGEGSKTIIPAQATAKVSMRLVANQDPKKIKAQFVHYVETLAPPTVEVEVVPGSLEYPSLVQRDDPAIVAATLAYEQVFGVYPVFTREGGSIPVVAMCQQILNLPVVLMGFGLPDDNLHAPNEKFHLPNFERGILTAIHYLTEYARLKSPGS